MTDDTAGGKAPHASEQSITGRPGGPAVPGADGTGQPAIPRIRVSTAAGFLAVVPHLLGFHPRRSMVVVGLDGPRGRVRLGFRYDLPDPPDAEAARDIAGHAVAVLRARKISTAIVAGFGEGALVTPVADAIRAAAGSASIRLRDVLRVQDGRYWSYTCQDPGCCPADGVPFEGLAHPDAAAMAAAGMTALPDRASLAACVAPVTGAQAEAMSQATGRALARAQDLIAASPARDRPRVLADAGRAAVREAIAVYRGGGQITDHDQMAWLTVLLPGLPVRDDAWARMEPRYRRAHLRLWTDVVRRAAEPYVPAAASLLAFTAWQSGDGVLANVAVERALAADPDYSLAHLVGQALEAGLPPSAARLPMTPEEVEASYAAAEVVQAARTVGTSPAAAAARGSAGRGFPAKASSGGGRASRGRGRGGPGCPGRGTRGRAAAGYADQGSATRPASRRPSA
jgi:hypothetical protein